MTSVPSPDGVEKMAETEDSSPARSAYSAAGVLLLGTLGEVGSLEVRIEL